MLFAVGLVMFILKLRTRSLRKSQMILRHKVNERTRELRDKNFELAKLSIVASETGNAVLVFDANKELEWINEGFTRMTGYTKDDLLRLRGSNILKVTYNSEMSNILDSCVRDKKSFIYETKMLRKNGEEFWTSSTLTPVFTEKGDLKNIVVIDTDITLRKLMEEQIRESLEEKGILLKEIHHRVKNNLQIIISLFNLQTSYINDAGAAKALKEGQDRIRTMALIHERFYQSQGESRIDFDDYIKRLCETIFQNQGAAAKKIKLNIEAEKISLDIDTAVPCGLIINELVSNAIRHAFNGNNGEILVKFMQLPDKKYCLIVKDNGKGLPPGVDYKKSDSLGIQLVQALTDQIEGSIQVENEMGLTVKVEFKPRQ
jgi:PAS domain S-box-containing protein